MLEFLNMSKKVVVVFNGNIESGKDSLENLLEEKYWSTRIENKELLYTLGSLVYGYEFYDYRDSCVNRCLKDSDIICVNDSYISPRNSLIKISDVIKDNIDEHFLSKNLAKTVLDYFDGDYTSCIVTTNIGYQNEFDNFVNTVMDQSNNQIKVLLVKIHTNNVNKDKRESINIGSTDIKSLDLYGKSVEENFITLCDFVESNI